MAGNFVCGFVFLIGLLSTASVNSQVLQKVFMFSRHSLRTPLTATLSEMTPKPLPRWKEQVGSLTAKGVLLETYMGTYFSEWLKQKHLIEQCPDEDSILIYSNTRQRTKATAKAFTESAFKDCNVKIHFKNITDMDPIFNTIVRNDSDIYKQSVRQEMADKLKEIDLTDVYIKINDLIDIKNSAMCLEDNLCDLSTDKNVLIAEEGLEPNMTGPLHLGNSMVDCFLMSYYEGMPEKDVAWGQIKTTSDWQLLAKILKENLNVRFNLTDAKIFAGPLLSFMKQKIIYGSEEFVSLFGHDSNIRSILRSLDFDSFELPEQYELSPIGGKIVFQKWLIEGKEYLKIEYVYQSINQIRNAEILSMENPPKSIVMSLKGCPINNEGFCLWEDFVKLLHSVAE